MGKIGPFVGLDYEIGPFVGIGPVVGIGLFGGTGLVVSLTDILYYLAANNKDDNVQSDLHLCFSHRLQDTFWHAAVRIKSLLPEMEVSRYLQASLGDLVLLKTDFCWLN